MAAILNSDSLESVRILLLNLRSEVIRDGDDITKLIDDGLASDHDLSDLHFLSGKLFIFNHLLVFLDSLYNLCNAEKEVS